MTEQELPDFQQFCEEFGIEPTAWQYKVMAILLKKGPRRDVFNNGSKEIMKLLSGIPTVAYLPKPEPK